MYKRLVVFSFVQETGTMGTGNLVVDTELDGLSLTDIHYLSQHFKESSSEKVGAIENVVVINVIKLLSQETLTPTAQPT